MTKHLDFRFAFYLIAIAWALSLASCVSVSVGPKGPEKSKGVEFAQPASPFTPLSGAKADNVWVNKKTGNTISYLSTCYDPSDPTLENATREMFADLKDLKVIKNEPATFDGRDALKSEVQGKSEGVLTQIRSLVFKKNGCLYTISLVGLAKDFDQDRDQFEKFVSGFKAP